MKVMIVDDSAVMRMMLKNMLQQIAEAEVLEAGNARSALEELIAAPVDVVLADVHMAEMSGIELLRTMKGVPALADIPVIVVSSDTDPVQIDEARELGAASYVTKPFRREALEEALNTALPGGV